MLPRRLTLVSILPRFPPRSLITLYLYLRQVYLIRDEPRTRTARTRRHTLMTAYQFVNSSVSEDGLMDQASAAMGGSSADYDWMGLEPNPTLLEVETADYFPHFSQVTLLNMCQSSKLYTCPPHV